MRRVVAAFVLVLVAGALVGCGAEEDGPAVTTRCSEFLVSYVASLNVAPPSEASEQEPAVDAPCRTVTGTSIWAEYVGCSVRLVGNPFIPGPDVVATERATVDADSATSKKECAGVLDGELDVVHGILDPKPG